MGVQASNSHKHNRPIAADVSLGVTVLRSTLSAVLWLPAIMTCSTDTDFIINVRKCDFYQAHVPVRIPH